MHIIFVHRGNANYLLYVLNQAHKSNPNAIIDLIGDEENNKYDFINHSLINDYFHDASEFAKHYINLSTNKEEFELFCFQRWFILKQFVQKNNINKFVYLDSDVMVFADLLDELTKFKDFEFTLSGGQFPGISFWNSQDAIVKFCNYIRNIYTKQDILGYNNLMEFAVQYRESRNPGGVCDMTLFKFYKSLHSSLIGETTEIINNSVYDDNFKCSINGNNNFKTQRGVKKIFWKNGQPFGLLKGTNIPILFNSLHFQGGTKTHMKNVYYQKKINISINFLMNYFRVYKIFNKIRILKKSLSN